MAEAILGSICDNKLSLGWSVANENALVAPRTLLKICWGSRTPERHRKACSQSFDPKDHTERAAIGKVEISYKIPESRLWPRLLPRLNRLKRIQPVSRCL